MVYWLSFGLHQNGHHDLYSMCVRRCSSCSFCLCRLRWLSELSWNVCLLIDFLNFSNLTNTVVDNEGSIVPRVETTVQVDIVWLVEAIKHDCCCMYVCSSGLQWFPCLVTCCRTVLLDVGNDSSVVHWNVTLFLLRSGKPSKADCTLATKKPTCSEMRPTRIVICFQPCIVNPSPVTV
eukprot:4699237-Amphidinium_carterae.2